MLAFIDESGSIHLKDSNPFSVLLAVCMPERVHRGVSRQLYSIQNMILGDANRELKAVDLINRRTFVRVHHKKDLIDKIFQALSSLDVAIFAVIVPRPAHPLNLPENYLPKPHTFLLQRINAWAERNNQEAILIYDGNGMNVQGINMALSIRNYIFRVAEYNNILRRLVDTPLFVDSKITPGIQLADLSASIVRQYEQFANSDTSKNDPYFLDIQRYYRIIRSKTIDGLLSDHGKPLFGFYRMQESQLLFESEVNE
ncbi:MAG: hypothetical protein OHK0052_12380 [Anaerolineales bacterium]